jgi:putative DNA-invertase from lambdoid prophage Rac
MPERASSTPSFASMTSQCSIVDSSADKVAPHMIDLGGDVTSNGISKLVFTILSAVAGNERDRIRERMRDVERHRASQRLFNGGKRPFGFDIEDEVKDRRLVPNAH